ncbi:hypothetical protein [Paenilisteria newyorkensis]|uniref:hypothetical protein n=1 Tax=Listeria newyorkensis TaxID=1497681 RepID=UPI000669F1C5|nr:hypothetical protein [Listeria newyorkensis]KMT62545.1 hypothetical protein X559_1083 [Listeria newyorkensis]
MTLGKSKLQIKREGAGLSVSELSYKASEIEDVGCEGHFELIISRIEQGKMPCRKPRKTYEWKSLAKALNCKVEDIWEEV